MMNKELKEKIKSEYISKNIIANVTRMCDYIIEKGDKDAPFSKKDIVNDDLRDHPIAEWYIVTHSFMNELKAQGECVIDLYDVSIWGRQNYGQMIIADKVIDKICEKKGKFKEDVL
jgi:hypothetical protein